MSSKKDKRPKFKAPRGARPQTPNLQMVPYNPRPETTPPIPVFPIRPERPQQFLQPAPRFSMHQLPQLIFPQFPQRSPQPSTSLQRPQQTTPLIPRPQQFLHPPTSQQQQVQPLPFSMFQKTFAVQQFPAYICSDSNLMQPVFHGEHTYSILRELRSQPALASPPMAVKLAESARCNIREIREGDDEGNDPPEPTLSRDAITLRECLQDSDEWRDSAFADVSTDDFVRFLEHGCLVAEQIAIKNQTRPCFKNIQNLCARTRGDILTPINVASNIHSQGLPWVTKDFIYAFIRMINAWHMVRHYADFYPGSLGTVESALTQDFRNSFKEWEQQSKLLASHLIRLFTTFNDAVFDTQSCYEMARQLESQLGGEIFSPLIGQIFDPSAGQLFNPFVGQIFDQVAGQVFNPLTGQAFNPLGGQAFNQLGEQMLNQLGGQMNQLGGQMERQMFEPMAAAAAAGAAGPSGPQSGLPSGFQSGSSGFQSGPTGLQSGPSGVQRAPSRFQAPPSPWYSDDESTASRGNQRFYQSKVFTRSDQPPVADSTDIKVLKPFFSDKQETSSSSSSSSDTSGAAAMPVPSKSYKEGILSKIEEESKPLKSRSIFDSSPQHPVGFRPTAAGGTQRTQQSQPSSYSHSDNQMSRHKPENVLVKQTRSAYDVKTFEPTPPSKSVHFFPSPQAGLGDLRGLQDVQELQDIQPSTSAQGDSQLPEPIKPEKIFEKEDGGLTMAGYATLEEVMDGLETDQLNTLLSYAGNLDTFMVPTSMKMVRFKLTSAYYEYVNEFVFDLVHVLMNAYRYYEAQCLDSAAATMKCYKMRLYEILLKKFPVYDFSHIECHRVSLGPLVRKTKKD